MSIDLSQFHQVFFEESFEGLDVMESALLNLDVGSVDSETINAIFRAAHSIKGGAGTFGFSSVAAFTHVVETLLDQIRSGDRALTPAHVELFLKSVDCVRQMIKALEAGEDIDTSESDVLKAQFNAILSGKEIAQAPVKEPVKESEPEAPSEGGWKIYFKPDVDVLKTGNEPLRMFRELEAMGPIRVEAHVDEVPGIGSIDPESCYLAWTIYLESAAERSAIDEVFEWVVDESELVIEPLTSTPEAAKAETAAHAEETSKPAPASADVALPETAITAQVVKAAAEAQVAEVLSAAQPGTNAATGSLVEDGGAGKKAADSKKSEVSSIRVGIDKIDSLINMVGELVITQSMLGELGRDFDISRLPKLMEGLEQLSQNTRELQENVMRIRMLPISFTFSRFPRLVHDLSRVTGKKIELKLLGEQTELDKTVMEKIGDPMVHLVRNSLDHGIEMPQDRIAAGKPETGTITLNAYHQGGSIVIQIIDDGRGLNREKIRAKAVEKGLIKETDLLNDEQIYELIFRPGFSTADTITDISGRGVGMDVVRRNIHELNGTVEVESTPGKGSVFTIRLPLTLAILDGQLIRVGQHTYILPLISIIESIPGDMTMVHRVAGGADVLKLRSEYVPIIRLEKILHIPCKREDREETLLVVVEGDNMKVALLVDDLLAQQQVVIKSLEENYKRVEGVSGATILGDGTVALILDITGLIKLAGVRKDDYKKLNKSGERAA